MPLHFDFFSTFLKLCTEKSHLPGSQMGTCVWRGKGGGGGGLYHHIISSVYLPLDFRVAYAANISEHLPTQP